MLISGTEKRENEDASLSLKKTNNANGPISLLLFSHFNSRFMKRAVYLKAYIYVYTSKIVTGRVKYRSA